MKLAVWALTPCGARLAETLARVLPDVHLHVSFSLAEEIRPQVPAENTPDCHVFTSLSHALTKAFNQYDGHVFIMSTGIVVRMIAPLIKHKTVDPAVVVIDDRGRHVISLLSGHIGGANALTLRIAERIGADPVITTATDVNDVPAIDVLARAAHLKIENPEAIKIVNMAFLTHRTIWFHDPYDRLFSSLPQSGPWRKTDLTGKTGDEGQRRRNNDDVHVFIDDIAVDLPPRTLILRPPTLVAGMGCNRNTPKEEMMELLQSVLKDFGLAAGSLAKIASISIKSDEPGLLELAQELGLTPVFFDREELKQVEEIQTPSMVVEKHIGVKSVCEAAAILATNRGKLIVPKHSTPNVTVAIARAATCSTS